jgi:YidC/Oxa1 family membrane protein insertase
VADTTRRILLAVALSLLVMWLYEYFVLGPYKAKQISESGTPATTAVTQPPPVAPPTEAPAPSSLTAPLGGAPSVTIETDLMRVVITSAGARLESLQLKDYRSKVAADSAPLDLVQLGPLLPMTLRLGGDEADAGLRYEADRGDLVLHADEEGEVVFSAKTDTGRRIEKRFRFKGSSYTFGVAVAVAGGEPLSALGLVVTAVPSERGKDGVIALSTEKKKLIDKPLKGLEKEAVPMPDAIWAGVHSQYFLMAVVPPAGSGALAAVVDGIPTVTVDAPASNDGKAAFSVFAGPKERSILRSAGHDLGYAISFGWFSFVAVPLLEALHLLHRLIGNYGVAIILLTALIRLATTPLNRATFRNMREMQKIQPQMTKLRERFKSDQAALQKEMMDLYKRHRVNPFAGCLLMLPQFPILVGFYNVLLVSIDLRFAPFMLWINDLSAPDRLMVAGFGIPVLTILMGLSMLAQQWLTPSQGDPTQQRMMMIMPLVFTFMFINMPSGLVLYWLVNNVLGVAQQYFMMRSTT